MKKKIEINPELVSNIVFFYHFDTRIPNKWKHPNQKSKFIYYKKKYKKCWRTSPFPISLIIFLYMLKLAVQFGNFSHKIHSSLGTNSILGSSSTQKYFMLDGAFIKQHVWRAFQYFLNSSCSDKSIRCIEPLDTTFQKMLSESNEMAGMYST